MKKSRLFFLLAIAAIGGFYACNKDNKFNPQGGDLPTHYIEVQDSGFTPNMATEANGSSFTFLNHTTGIHTIMSDDTFTIKHTTLLPDSFLFFKPDTVIASQLYIPYHCVEHPTARGVIILNP